MGPERPPFDSYVSRDTIDLVYGIVARHVGRGPTADDLTQEVFVQAKRSDDLFDPMRGTFNAWLWGITRNVVRQHWKGEAERRGLLDALAGMEEPVDEVPADVDHIDADIIEEINALSPRDRALVMLRGVFGWSSADVGRRLRMKESNVNTAFHRICGRLATNLRARRP